MPTIDRSATIAQIVAAHPETARVFQRHGIDFCCRGGVPIAEACRGRAVDPDALGAELDRAVALASDGPPQDDPRLLATPALLKRIVDRHHVYLRDVLPPLRPLAEKVARVHGAHEPRLVPLAGTVEVLAGMLLPHLDQEEQVLFPALVADAPDAAVIARELELMHADHLAVGDKLGELRTLTGGFVTPEWGCASYGALMRGLEELEGDTLRHVHLENHVLMPRFTPARAVA